MRLINANTLELEEFLDDNIPRYAILSHTWGQEEVSFQDLCWLHDYEKNQMTYASVEALIPQIGQNMEHKATAIRQRAGFDKIVKSALIAIAWDIQYVWLDTCCIDKTSSAELSEAINSMFRWYRNSNFCLAFLSDVDSRGEGYGGVRFEDSRWFTRGWTLQELLAPEIVVFYDRSWRDMANRSSLAKRIASITGIPKYILAGDHELNLCSLASRMSWASKRRTSRKEDMAYCLMGLFGVNMPLLYGEGDKAFIRLQHEIIKEHRGKDESLFAWGYNESVLTHGSIFAPSPALMGNGEIRGTSKLSLDTLPFDLSNKGLDITLDLFRAPLNSMGFFDVYYALWKASFPSETDNKNKSWHRLFFPLFPSVRHPERGKLKDGQYMAKCLSGPLMVSKRHVPVDRFRRRLMITRDNPAWSLGFSSIVRLVKISLSSLYQILPFARLVETFTPPLHVEMKQEGSEAEFVFVKEGQLEAYAFRFLVFNSLGEETMRGGKAVQLAVFIDLRGPRTKTLAVEWMDGSRVTDSKEMHGIAVIRGATAGGNGEQKEDPAAYCSLLDAAFAGVPLLDTQRWFDKGPPFLINGKPLEVKVDADSFFFNYRTRTWCTRADVTFSSF